MSRRINHKWTDSEQEHLNRALNSLGLERVRLSKRGQIAIYERFCKVPLSRFEHPHKLEDQTLLLNMLVVSTLTCDYKREALKHRENVDDSWAQMLLYFSWIIDLRKQGGKK